MEDPEQWTNDMSIALPSAYSHEDVAKVVLASLRRRESYETTHDLLVSMGVNCGDAALAYDRVQAGLVRARTWSRRNRPDEHKDPIAYATYELARSDRSLIRTLRHQS